MAAANLSGAALLEAVKADLLRLYATAPAYGSLTFTVHFYEGRLVRTTSGAEVNRQAKP